MPATIKATLTAETPQDKTHAVRISNTKDRRVGYVNSGVYIPPISSAHRPFRPPRSG